MGGWYFHIRREMLTLFNKVITNLGNVFDEVVESVGKVFIGDARGHR